MTATMQKTIDGSLISRADLERLHNEEEMHAEAMRKAAVTIAAMSTDPADARMLFDLLGLDEVVLAQARGELHSRTGATKTAKVGPKRSAKETAA